MSRFLGFLSLLVVGAAMVRIGQQLSPESVAMAVGVIFGMIAGIPVFLLVMSSYRPQQVAYAEEEIEGEEVIGEWRIIDNPSGAD